jgi:hypothetical protein
MNPRETRKSQTAFLAAGIVFSVTLGMKLERLIASTAPNPDLVSVVLSASCVILYVIGSLWFIWKDGAPLP